MKTMVKLIKTLFLIGMIVALAISVQAQPEEISTLDKLRHKTKLIREKDESSWVGYNDKNWNDKFTPRPDDLGYKLGSFAVDPVQIKTIVRKEITRGQYDQLNRSGWVIETKLTGDGQIVSVSFRFKDDTGVNVDDFAILAERIKKEIRWKLSFNKEVSDLFYLQLTIPGPKL